MTKYKQRREGINIINNHGSRKRGAQPGNKNAIGNKGGRGGPYGNLNAEKHGLNTNIGYRIILAKYINRMNEINRCDLLFDEGAVKLAVAGIKKMTYRSANIDKLVKYVIKKIDG